MKFTLTTILLTALLMTGCARKQELERWEELQFRVTLRSTGYKPGDALTSGQFEDVLVMSVPIRIQAGPGEAHTVRDGVWLHLAWEDLTVYEKLNQLGFDGFRSRVENRFTSPYGTSWQDNGWEKHGRVGISTEWDMFQTPVGIAGAAGMDQRVWCKMWRWVRSTSKPDIILGEKRKT